ncbi:MAG: hypothetical protein K2O18_16470 [Oscillospiraceae bacterium]|nr:hypothetical protein [Oscillospiraceae bacterium]
MTYIHYRNYKGGVNNLCIARDSETGLVATSTKGKERAILNLDHKITLRRLEEQGKQVKNSVRN